MCYDREKDPLLVLNFKLSVCDTDKGDRQTPLTKLSYCWLSSGNLRNMALQDSAPSLACFGCLDELFARGFGTRRIPNSFLFYVSNLDLFSSYDGRVDCPKIKQVQATEMYGAAQPDFFKSEVNGGIKNIISYHLKIIKRCVFSPNLEVVAQKISLPRP